MLRNNKCMFLLSMVLFVVAAITLTGCGSDEKLVYVQAAGNTSDALLKHLVKVVSGQDAILNTSSFSMNIPAGTYAANTEIVITEDVNYSTLDSSFSSRFTPQSSLLSVSVSEPNAASVRESILGGLLASSVPQHNYMTAGSAKISVRLSNVNSYSSSAKYFMACRTRINGKSKWNFNDAVYANGVFTTYFNTKYDGFMLVRLNDSAISTIVDGFEFAGPDTVSAGFVGTFSQDVEFSLGFKLDTSHADTFYYDKLDISFVSFDRTATPSLSFEELARRSGESYELTMQGTDGYYYTLPAKLGYFASYDVINGNATYTFRLKLRNVSVENFPSKLLMTASYKLYDNEEYTAEKLIEFKREGTPDIYPDVVGVFPEDETINLAAVVNNKIVVTFKEAMEAKSLSNCLTVQEKDNPATSKVCEFVSLSDDGLVATFPFNFEIGKEYTATVNGASNVYGHAMLDSHTWSFKIVGYSGIDTATVTQANGTEVAADTAVDVATNTVIALTYQKAIADTTEVNFVLAENGVEKDIAAFEWEEDNKAVTITPAAKFAYNANVTLTVTGGKDSDGYDVDDFSCGFAVVGQNTITTRSPLVSATSVGTNEPILVTFTAAMADNTPEYFSVQRKLTNENVFSNFANIGKALENGNTVLRILPTGGKWDYNASYKVIITGTPNDDNNNEIIVDIANWVFVTEAGNAPVISDANITNITRYTANVSFTMAVTGGKPVQSDSIGLEVAEYDKTFDNENIATFAALLVGNTVNVNLSGLSRNTAYKFRAFYKVADDDAVYLHTFNNDFRTAKWEGLGTESTPYLISSLDEFVDIVGDEQKNYFFKQTANIDLSGIANWTPLGATIATAFKGTYDGDSKTITGLNIASNGKSNLGLFGYVNSSTLKNIVLKNITINEAGSGSAIGSLVGYIASSNITNCSISNANITGNSTVGGLVGDAYGTAFTSCAISGNSTVIGNATANTMTGGFVGRAGSGCTFTGCSINGSESSVNVYGFNQVGGFVGLMNDIASSYENCVVTTNVYVKHVAVAGKIIQTFGCFAGEMKGGSIQNATIESVNLECDNYAGGVVGIISSNATGGITNVTIGNVKVYSRNSGSESLTGIVYGNMLSATVNISGCHVTSPSLVTAYLTTTPYNNEDVP